MISISIFFVSLIGLISLLSFSVWERRSGKKVWVSQRRALDYLVFSAVENIKKRIPKVDKHVFVRLYHGVLHSIALLTLRVLKILERKMSGVVNAIRGKRELTSTQTQSDFLKKVSEHKNSLGKKSHNTVE